MSVPVECPKCRHLFYVPDEYVGKKGKCPKCAHVFRAQPEEVDTFPSVEGGDELPVMPVVATGTKKASPPAPPKPPPIDESSTDIPTFVVTTAAKKGPPKAAPLAAPSDELPTFATLPAKTKSPGGKESVVISVPEPAASKPSDSAEIPSFVVAPASGKGSAAKSSAAKPALSDSGSIHVVAPADKGKLPKGTAKAASDSTADAALPSIDIGAAAKPTSGVRPGVASATAGPAATPDKETTPNWIPIAAIGGVVALIAIGLVVWSQMGGKPPVATPGTAGKKEPGEKGSTPPPGGKKPDTTPTQNPVTARETDPKAIAATMALAGPSLVRVEVTRKGSKTSGLGTVVDERGWIATSYDLVSGADQVVAHFQGGTAAESAGTIAVDATHGLAVIAIAELPAGIVKRPVTGASTINATQILFPGVNEGVTPALKDTMVRTFQKYKELPFTVQKSLGSDLRRDDELAWIEHDIPVAANAAGGPLFDARGNLVGIRLPLSGAGPLGYAVPSKFLAQILTKATGEVTPFDPSKVVTTPTPPVTPNPPITPPTPEPMPPNPAAGDVERRTTQLARLASLIKTGDARRFSADSAEQYAELREIAELIHDLGIEAAREGLDEKEKTRIETGREAALEALGDFLWPDDIATTNKQALEGIKEPGKGVFAYIEIVASQDKIHLAQLSGTENLLAFTATQNMAQLGPSGRFLIIGRHDPNQTLMVQINNMQKMAFLVNARQLIGKPLP